MSRGGKMIFLLVFITMLLLMGQMFKATGEVQAELEQVRYRLEQAELKNSQLKEQHTEIIHNLQADNQALQQEIDYIMEQEREVIDGMRKWLNEWQVMVSEITGYAPLDPRAIEGWDYKGSPNITASGERVVIGETAAGPPDVEFGTLLYFPERNDWRVIHDRGSLVQYNKEGMPQFDLAVATKEEARGMGRASGVLAVAQRW